MTETKEERIAYARKVKFDLAVRDHADKLCDDWRNAVGGFRRPLSRAYELLSLDIVRQAVARACVEAVRAYDPGTMARPTDERRVAELYGQGKFDLSELPHLRQFLNSWTLAALIQGVLTARGLGSDAVATGTRRVIAADRWQILQPDFKASTASVDGNAVYGIEVEVAQSKAPSGRHKVSQSKLTKWYRETWVPSCQAGGRIPDRDEDFREAKAHFNGGHFDRDWLRDLRPPDWSLPGRRRRHPRPAS